MIKIILLIALFGASGFLGFQTAKVFESKTKFYKDALDFTKNIKAEISFLKTDIISLLSKYNFSSKFENVKNDIKELYKSNKEISIDDIKHTINKYITIKDEEVNIISQMFFELGQLGYIEQIERLEYYINHFQSVLSKEKDRADKMMPFCKKMGVLIGLLVCIVLI